MQGNSKTVTSSQRQPHQRLQAVVGRHLTQRYRKPVQQHNRIAFEQVQQILADSPEQPLILDAGCGTGESTARLAAQHPDCRVIGVDRSAVRLSRLGVADRPACDGNAIWVRADLVDFWRLAAENGWRLHKHYLLYPNPYPKPEQLRRRWHAHPVFPSLLALGGELELRSNWRLYITEFAEAIQCVTGLGAEAREYTPDEFISPFETKYARSGQRLYRLRCRLSDTKE